MEKIFIHCNFFVRNISLLTYLPPSLPHSLTYLKLLQCIKNLEINQLSIKPMKKGDT